MSTRGARAIAFTIQGPLERSDLPGLCNRVCAILQDGRPEVAYCEVSGVEPDVIFLIVGSRCCLSPGLMRSGL